jgi:hypothetical protein
MFSEHWNIIGTLELDFYPPGEPIIISCREQNGTLLGLARTRQGDVTWKVPFLNKLIDLFLSLCNLSNEFFYPMIPGTEFIGCVVQITLSEIDAIKLIQHPRKVIKLLQQQNKHLQKAKLQFCKNTKLIDELFEYEKNQVHSQFLNL